MTRKERHIRVLRITEDFLSGESDARTHDEVLEAVRYALGAPCPPWWAEHVYEERAIAREYLGGGRMRDWLELLWLRFQTWRLRKYPVNPTYTGRAVLLTYDPSSRRVEDAREVSFQDRDPASDPHEDERLAPGYGVKSGLDEINKRREA